MALAYGFVIFIVLGTGLMVWSAMSYLPYLRARSWPSTSAVIREAKVESRSVVIRYGTVSCYYPVAEYEYMVNGQCYRGSRVSFELENVWEEKDDLGSLQAEWVGWKVGAQLPVYYKSGNPGQAVLVRSMKASRRSHYSAIFVAGLLCVGLGVGMAGLHA